MTTYNLSTTVHVCEDINKNFDIRDLLIQAGYSVQGELNIKNFTVLLPDDTESTVNTPLFGMLDADTVYVRPGDWAANYNGSFSTIQVTIDKGNGDIVQLSLQVIIDPVNDAPDAADKTFTLVDGSSVVLSESDFGFHDDVEHDGFKSIVITNTTTAGQVLLNGVAVAVGTEVSIDDIRAGHLVFVPSQTVAGDFDLGFKVRDDGGTAGCNAQDLSLAPHYLTFKVPMAHLGDFVWEDKNANGVQDAGEAGIANVVVQLKDTAGNVVASTTTDASGGYHFDVNPGTYSVTVVAPAGYVPTAANQGGDTAKDSNIDAAGKMAPVTLAPGETNLTLDAGLYRTAELGDRVWFDTNKNGVQDAGEAGAAGVKVTLLDASGNAVGSPLITDANGNYLFTNLKPGAYSVQFDKTTLPSGYAFTGQDQGGDDQRDSDANADGRTAQVLLASGDSNHSVDAGIVALPATLGDRVWHDSNMNGVQDAGESGIVGVTVQLKNAAGSVIGSTVTDATGYYNFSVDPGTYSIAVVAPAGYLTTVKDAGGNDALDSDINTLGNSGQVTVAAGQNYRDLDAGLYKTASIGDRVWFDANGNGTQDAGEAGVGGVKVNLYNEQGAVVASATTDASGNYLFSNLVPGNYYLGFVPPAGYGFTKADIGGYATDSDVNPATGFTTTWATLKSGETQLDWDAGLVKLNTASIGDRVWEDKNYNGVQEAGELGVAGVKVNLLNAYNQVIATTTTNASGNYLFSELAAGSYKVEVIRPSGFYYTKANVGVDTADSDVDVSTGRSGLINLAAGQNDMSWDAGIYRKASLGDKVWRDADHDGVQDYNEAGIANIKVQLYSGSGVLLATTYTNAYGNYLFSNLDPGSYSLKFDKSGVYHAGYAMDTWKWGAKNVGANDNIDSDVNSNGTTGNVVYTDILKLASGQNDMSWDAAITPIVIDLNGDGVHTIARADFHGSFDLLGTGNAIQTGWVSAQDGLLAIDSNGNGKIDNISELFGGNEKGTGFAKLSSYDSNGDGVVDAHDDKFAELRIWRDANSNGVTDDGELMSLHDAGVASLTVSYTELPFLDANSNLHLERSSATLADGKSVDMTDVYFNVDAKDAAAAGVALPSMADLLRDDSTLDVVLGQDGAVNTVAAAQAAIVAPAAEAQAQCEMADLLRRAMAHANTQPQEMAA
ncbi:Serine-aspartate repeat-containing protein D precursor [Janthinobacterium sp. KBS0711]|uniref:SdrD B-like domain-containing protein n=1 Tax=Janthinobacterium sp. KBS0711 TaxID=1649647 RepID=UPI0006335E8F|nr:SdrD B-like domain-containing protein [Janthinobacterium sp. KBS0711]KKO64936.1 Serine-aspartate repeat-containing protein D precursor [Janthinobacterium sp. KBS0711]